MSPIEHYFENLLIRGSDNKGEPNKNALSKEVQEAIEICAYYIKSTQLYRNANDSNSEKVAMLNELKYDLYHELCKEIHGKEDCPCIGQTISCLATFRVCDVNRAIDRTIQNKINALKEDK